MSLIVFMLPDIRRGTRIEIGLYLGLPGLALLFFTTDLYNHWKYFDENNFKIECHQVPPMFADEKNFYYRYIVFTRNIYPENIKLSDIQLTFQTALTIDTHEILLDLHKNPLIMNVEGSSILSARADQLKGKEVFAISVDCSFLRKELLLANHGATVNMSYMLFGQEHKKSIYVNPMAEMPFKMPSKAAIVCDLTKFLDHRNLTKIGFTHYYYKARVGPGDRAIEIYCPDVRAKLLEIKYEGSHGTVIFQSEKPIYGEFDPIRVIVISDDSIQVHSMINSFGKFRKKDAAVSFRNGLDLVCKKNYVAGADAFRRATEIDAKDFQAWFNYGLALEFAGNNKSAIMAFQEAIRIRENYSKAHCELANVLIKDGNEVEAISHLNRAIEINPKYALAYFKLGCLQKSQGKTEEAHRNLEKAIEYETRPEVRDKFQRFLDEVQTLEYGESQLFP